MLAGTIYGHLPGFMEETLQEKKVHINKMKQWQVEIEKINKKRQS